MNKRRVILGIFFGIIMALLAGFLLYPAIIIGRFNKDLIHVSTIHVDIGESNIDLGIDIVVRREAPFHKLLDSISYTVNFDTFQFVSGSTRLDSVRGGADFDSILLPVTIDMAILKDAINTLKGKDSTNLIIRFVAHYQWPIIDKVDVPIEIVRRMPPPNPPEVKLLSIDIEKFSFSEPIVDVSLQLINKNPFSVKIKDLRLYMEFENLFNAEINHPKIIHIKPKDVSNINVRVQVHELKTLKTVWTLLVRRNEVDYNMRMRAKIITEDGSAEPIDVTLTTSGSVQTKSRKEKRQDQNEKPKRRKSNNKK